MPQPLLHTILWTSGWDSTYLVLDLLVVKREAVRPVYVIDRGRPSWRIELATMDKIAGMLKALDPEAHALLQPRIVFEKDGLKPNAAISVAFNKLKTVRHIGSQYEWLALLAEQEGYEAIELGVHKDDPFVKFSNEEDFSAYRRFAFPLLGVTKVQMGENAKRHGFAALMEETWFCHHPLRGRPCGTCYPCRQTIEEGMARRVPPRSFFDRVVYFQARRVLRAVRKRVRRLLPRSPVPAS